MPFTLSVRLVPERGNQQSTTAGVINLRAASVASSARSIQRRAYEAPLCAQRWTPSRRQPGVVFVLAENRHALFFVLQETADVEKAKFSRGKLCRSAVARAANGSDDERLDRSFANSSPHASTDSKSSMNTCSLRSMSV